MAGGRRWWRNGAASLSHGIPHHGPSTTIPRASGATAGQNSFNGSWPTPANYADRGTRSRCTISAPSKTSTPRGRNTSPNGSRGWLHATARPSSSAVSATRTSTPDVLHADHDEHRRASCYGKRARLVRRGAVGKGPGQLAPRRRPTLPQVRFCERRGVRFPPPTLLVVLCHSQEQAEQVKARLAEWLAPRGLAFNEDKTKIVCLGAGFDFLGFNVRRYYSKLLIKPSKAAIRRLRERLAAETRKLRGLNAVAVITTLSPIVRGWAAYYRTVVSSEVFRSLDTYLWRLLYKWARWR